MLVVNDGARLLLGSLQLQNLIFHQLVLPVPKAAHDEARDHREQTANDDHRDDNEEVIQRNSFLILFNGNDIIFLGSNLLRFSPLR